jgi:putative (di)nucleoside polyphosphate hydrolase
VTAALPYRPNVGICLFGPDGRVFAGRAPLNPDAYPDPERIVAGHEWMMPQGGIDPEEEIVAAARRELWEETGVRATTFLAVTEDWWRYDFPARGGAGHKLHPFRGQEQRWAAFRYDGDGSDISITAEHCDQPAEFLEWRWMPLAEMPSICPEHRRPVYERAVAAFASLAGSFASS